MKKIQPILSTELRLILDRMPDLGLKDGYTVILCPWGAVIDGYQLRVVGEELNQHLVGFVFVGFTGYCLGRQFRRSLRPDQLATQLACRARARLEELNLIS